MAFERRGNRRYFYRSVRVGRRVYKEYGGGGKGAALIAQLEGLWAERRRSEWEEEQYRQTRRKRRFKRVYAALDRAKRLAGEALRAAGWHQHKREWRRRRRATISVDIVTLIDTWIASDLRATAGKLDPEAQAKTSERDRSVLPMIDQFVDSPAATALWGDTGRQLLSAWARQFGKADRETEQALFRGVSNLRAGLIGPAPSLLVRLLAERVLICWVALRYFERRHARALGKELASRIHQCHQRAVDFARRHLLAAARTLAKIRKAKLVDLLVLVTDPPRAVGKRSGVTAGRSPQPRT
ncbi:MAG: hypothetical protein JWO38_6120 [Gemmataceae bacterium]|nr:hypothetical protein [Gemmataceae bacterium]